MLYIKNNPIDCIFAIFEKYYSDVTVDIIQFDNIPEDEGYGYTHITTDGVYAIGISVDIPIATVAEILAHELAHVVDITRNGMPLTGEEHRKSWDDIFSHISEVYENEVVEFINSRK